MRFANKFTTYTCYSWLQWFSPIHYPKQLDDTRGWMALRRGRKPRRETAQGYTHFLCTIYWVTFTQCLTMGWAEESCWDASCRASDVKLSNIKVGSQFGVQLRHESIHNITFPFQIHFPRSSCVLARVSFYDLVVRCFNRKCLLATSHWWKSIAAC